MKKIRMMALAISISVATSGAALAGAADPVAKPGASSQTAQRGKKPAGTTKKVSPLAERMKRSDAMKRATEARKQLSSGTNSQVGN